METKKELYASLMQAVEQNEPETVEKLLADGADPSINNHHAFQWACANGLTNIVEKLLKHPKTNPGANGYYGLWTAAQNNHEATVRLLLTHGVDPSAADNKALVQASAFGCKSMVELLLSDTRVSPSTPHNQPIRHAIMNGHINIVELFLTYPAVYEDKTWLDTVFPQLMKQGNEYMTGYLLGSQQLSYYKSIPNFIDNNLRLACRHGLENIAKILLKEPSVLKKEPKKYKTLSILSEAALNGHLAIVDLLLNDERIDPLEQHFEALCQAAKGGCLAVVKRLVMVPNMEQVYLNYALNYAAMYDRTNIMEFLLKEFSVDPSFNNNQAFKLACAYNRTDAVKLLLADDRVISTFSAWGASVISTSFLNKNKELVKMVLSNEQILKQVDLIRPQIHDDQLSDFDEICQALKLPSNEQYANQFNERKMNAFNQHSKNAKERMLEDMFRFTWSCCSNSNLPQLPPKPFAIIANYYQQLHLSDFKEVPHYVKRPGDSSGFLPDGHIVVVVKPKDGNKTPIEIYHPINGLVKTFDAVNNGAFINSLSNGNFIIKKSRSDMGLYHPSNGFIDDKYEYPDSKSSVELPNGNLVTYSKSNFDYGNGYYSMLNPGSNEELRTFNTSVDSIEHLSVLPNGYILTVSKQTDRRRYKRELINTYHIYDFDNDENGYDETKYRLGFFWEEDKPEDIPTNDFSFRC